MLVEVVGGEKFKNLVSDVQITLLEELLHPPLEVLDYLTGLDLGQVKLCRLRVAEALELLLRALHVEAAKLSVRDFPLFQLSGRYMLKRSFGLRPAVGAAT